MTKVLQIWQALDHAYAAHAPMPTMRELCATCNISSTSVAADALKRLEREGIITRAAGKARSITLEKRYGE